MIYLLRRRAANEAAARHRHASASRRAVPSAGVLGCSFPTLFCASSAEIVADSAAQLPHGNHRITE